MRVIIIALLAAVLIGCGPEGAAQSSAQEDIVRRDRVLPFAEAKTVRLRVESGKYDGAGQPVFTRASGQSLTQAQRGQFEASIWIETPIKVSDHWDEMDACFIPHHFFEYYDASGQKLGEAQVCFCCAGIAITPDDRIRLEKRQRLRGDFGKLKALVASMGEPTDIECS